MYQYKVKHPVKKKPLGLNKSRKTHSSEIWSVRTKNDMNNDKNFKLYKMANMPKHLKKHIKTYKLRLKP